MSDLHEEMIEELTNSFLGWKLPEDFMPDGGVAFHPPRPPNEHLSWPVGTNLFTHTQAKAMFEYLLKDTKGIMEITAERIESLEAIIDRQAESIQTTLRSPQAQEIERLSAALKVVEKHVHYAESEMPHETEAQKAWRLETLVRDCRKALSPKSAEATKELSARCKQGFHWMVGKECHSCGYVAPIEATK